MGGTSIIITYKLTLGREAKIQNQITPSDAQKNPIVLPSTIASRTRSC